VGNLAVGGRGKTPLVAALAELLVEMGERPAILTRGYRRRQPSDGVVVVSDGLHLKSDLGRSGDEPLMLARRLRGTAVLVSPDRYTAGCLAERRFAATVHLLDDGFQHMALWRDVDLVVVSVPDLAEGASTLPFGSLREPVEAIRRADAVIMAAEDTEDDTLAVETIAGLNGERSYRVRRVLGAARMLNDGRVVSPQPDGRTDGNPPGGPAHEPSPLRVLAVAGIARPERFTADLRKAGWEVAQELLLSDHEPMTPQVLARIEKAATETGAALVLTTEKDAVRMLRYRPLGMPIASVPIQVKLEPDAAFREWFRDRIQSARIPDDQVAAGPRPGPGLPGGGRKVPSARKNSP
jgi:tetraacyldisaccharide 4'-kinase